MSKARDIANILSASTSIATDAEVTTAVSNHATAANGHIGRGTTLNRPISPTIGDLYFDTTLLALIAYKSNGWEKVSQDPAPQIASISPTTAATTGTTITVTGSNFKTGVVVQFIGSDTTVYSSPVATFVGNTIVTATTPTLSVANEPYDVKVINNDNQFAILENVLDAGGSPTWNTASGTVATINEQTALNVSVSATDPDGTSIVYSSSNLPAWISLNSSTGALTGTSPDISSNTTYSFNITASDGVNSSSRSFNVINTLPPLSVEYLVVGGGGAGGNGSGAGGGGAGGYRTGSLTLATSTSYSVSVGLGGVGSASSLRGANGVQSQFSSIYGSGGGGGGTEADVSSGFRSGASGGSGGGGCYINTGAGGAGGLGNSGSYSPSEGNNGGAGAIAGGSNYGGGGGGGAGSSGSVGPGSGAGGNGGSGVSNSITGTSLFYAGGGGGGAQNSNTGATPGSGGSSIGGIGGVYNGASSTPGAVNTGSGGGGGAFYGSNPTGGAGSSGGSGIVVIKYPSSYSMSQSGGLTLSTSTAVTGYKITSFTSGSGTVSFSG